MDTPFDGKLIEWLDMEKMRYLGLDADWEGGLDIALKKYGRDNDKIVFRKSLSHKDLDFPPNVVDLAVSMETLEHIAPAAVPKYLGKLAHITNRCALLTVPNEIGVVFFIKSLAKAITGRPRHYTFSEFFGHCFGRTRNIRLPNGKGGHKGFNYRAFVETVAEHFEVKSVVGIPFRFLPPYLNFTVGIVALPRGDALNVNDQ